MVSNIGQARIKKRELLEVFIKEFTKNNNSLLESQDSIFVIEFNGYLIFLNQTCTSLSGYTAEEAQTLSFLKLVSLDDIDKVYNHFLKTVEGNIQCFDCEIINKNGQRIEIHITKTPIIVDGEFVGVLAKANNQSKR
ncbi:PAS domain S-box protein [Neobacillus niacini]|uniref:PAS domain S-box protein n=1 Tax=Neobacillus niacini TaxID=86668 RepID=UPI0007AB627D|nr:PAS domain S-box protein [Neobacillus niacini]MEC1526236.1 PAS domain S-box protein [Neobacillus niacini]